MDIQSKGNKAPKNYFIFRLTELIDMVYGKQSVKYIANCMCILDWNKFKKDFCGCKSRWAGGFQTGGIKWVGILSKTMGKNHEEIRLVTRFENAGT